MASDTVSFRPSPKLKERIDDYAEANDCSASQALEDAADVGLEQLGYGSAATDTTLDIYAYEAAKYSFAIAAFLTAFHVFLPGSYLFYIFTMGAFGGVALFVERKAATISSYLGLPTPGGETA